MKKLFKSLHTPKRLLDAISQIVFQTGNGKNSPSWRTKPSSGSLLECSRSICFCKLASLTQVTGQSLHIKFLGRFTYKEIWIYINHYWEKLAWRDFPDFLKQETEIFWYLCPRNSTSTFSLNSKHGHFFDRSTCSKRITF